MVGTLYWSEITSSPTSYHTHNPHYDRKNGY